MYEWEADFVGRIYKGQFLSVGDRCTVIGLAMGARTKGCTVLVVKVDERDVADGQTCREPTPDTVLSTDLLVRRLLITKEI